MIELFTLNQHLLKFDTIQIFIYLYFSKMSNKATINYKTNYLEDK
jgi:hypothetical protein